MIRLDIANIALLRGDYRLAEEQLALVNGATLSVHGRCAELSVRIFADVMRNRWCDAASLAELIGLGNQLRRRPTLEMATVAAAMGLTQQGRPSDAIALAVEYTTKTRREPWKSRNPIMLSFLAGRPIGTAGEARNAIGLGALQTPRAAPSN